MFLYYVIISFFDDKILLDIKIFNKELIKRSYISPLKRLGLYLYTLIISHKFCKMLSILNKHCKRICKILWQIVCLWTKSKNTTTTKQKIKHKKPCRSRKLNPETLAPKADALPLHYRVNWDYGFLNSYLTVSTQWIET